MNTKKLHDSKMILLLFWLCWVVYFCSYLGRLNYSSAMPQMIKESVLDRSQAGFISTLFFTFYAAGQLINGFLGDKISSKLMIFIGILVAGGANLFMGIFQSFELMAICWAVNGYASSMVWPPIVRLFSTMLSQSSTMKCFTNIASTSALGTLCAYLLSALMIDCFGWKAVFISAAIILILVSVLWFYSFGAVERFYNQNGVEEVQIEVDNSAPTEKTPFLKLVFSPAILIILLPIIVHGVLKDGVTAWVPTYISEVFLTSPVLSILATTALPIINLTGAYAAQYVRKHWLFGEIKTVAFFFGIALIGLISLFLFGSVNLVLTVILLSVITSSMLAVNTIVISYVPMYFSKYGRASTMSGFLNSVAYVGSAISSVSIGLLVSNAGWSVTILSWCFITGVAFLVSAFGRKHTFH